MKTHILSFLSACIILIVGAACNTIYKGTVIITDVVDSVSKEYGRLYARGLITNEQDKRATDIHDKYREAMGKVEQALLAVEAGTGTKGDVASALRTAKNAVEPLINLIAPFLGAKETANYKLKLQNSVAK